MPVSDQLHALAVRVRAEYREMPGLSLTAEQAARLWGIDHALCEQVLRDLLLDGALYYTSRGAYVAGPATRERT